jgi:glycogen(starch) synthase
MRILITTDTVGGVWTFAKQLSSELLARGVHVALVSVGRAPSDAQITSINALCAEAGKAFQFTASCAPLEWMEDNGRAYTDAAPLLLKVIEDFRADLILCNQFCFGALPFDGPKVIVAHSDVLSWAKACREEGLQPSRWLQQYCALASTGLAKADAVVAPTHWMLQALEENFRTSGELHVIYNGRAIGPAPVSAARQMQAVTAGRLWDEGKNLKLLSSLKLSLPLLIAGETGDHAPRSTTLRGDTAFLGQLQEEDLLSLFRQSSIYICTSKYEPFGLAPLEAALCGCAVVANNIPSLREVWGDAALYYEDAVSLSALLAHLSRNSDALSAARRHARWRASHFSAWRMAESYMELFRSLSSSRVGTHAA